MESKIYWGVKIDSSNIKNRSKHRVNVILRAGTSLPVQNATYSVDVGANLRVRMA
ncbi:MAG: hypothetical protein KAI83_19040 [Thiomargarita sp.]|nr:hypothetical protein [Thiomargarita sp.]